MQKKITGILGSNVFFRKNIFRFAPYNYFMNCVFPAFPFLSNCLGLGHQGFGEKCKHPSKKLYEVKSSKCLAHHNQWLRKKNLAA